MSTPLTRRRSVDPLKLILVLLLVVVVLAWIAIELLEALLPRPGLVKGATPIIIALGGIVLGAITVVVLGPRVRLIKIPIPGLSEVKAEMGTKRQRVRQERKDSMAHGRPKPQPCPDPADADPYRELASNVSRNPSSASR